MRHYSSRARRRALAGLTVLVSASVFLAACGGGGAPAKPAEAPKPTEAAKPAAPAAPAASPAAGAPAAAPAAAASPAAAAVAGGGTVSCAEAATKGAGGDKIVIGADASLTGPTANFGTGMKR